MSFKATLTALDLLELFIFKASNNNRLLEAIIGNKHTKEQTNTTKNSSPIKRKLLKSVLKEGLGYMERKERGETKLRQSYRNIIIKQQETRC